MGLKESMEKFRVMFEGTSLESRLAPRYPGLAVEVDPERITGVRVQQERKTGRLVARKAAWRDLPVGAIELSLNRPNIVDAPAVGAALDEVLRELGSDEHRVSVLIPDPAARVALLGFNTLPGTRKELLDLVRFRMAKSLPFKSDEAALDVMPAGTSAGAVGEAATGSVLAVFMHRPVLDQYEELFTSRGYWPGLIGLSTLELFNLFRKRLDSGAHERDLMFVNLTRRFLAVLILSQGQIIFYRCKPHTAQTGPESGTTGLRREIYTSLAFYQEKLLGRGIGRACLRVGELEAAPILEAVQAETNCPVELLRLSGVVERDASLRLDDAAVDRLMPAAGAAAGRWR